MVLPLLWYRISGNPEFVYLGFNTFCSNHAPNVLVPALTARSSNSRIPEATFGTAEEDALRRDFTINALFYNVTTRQVEDMTNRYVR